jgi:lysine 6-dehydrogenase
MGYRYAVVGAGRQGTAAAHDLLHRGEAGRLLLVDRDPAALSRAAARLEGCTTAVCDVGDETALARALDGIDAVIAAVPYFLVLPVTRAAVAAGAHCCDFGGNTEIVLQQLALHETAAARGVSIVPDCGMAPGLGNHLAVYTMGLLDEPAELFEWDGGLPQHPQPPYHYSLPFSIEGLINEYWGEATFLRDGQVVQVPVFTEYEEIAVPGFGLLEAFVTSGGTSTCPYSFRGRLKTFQTKTLRYRGHYQQMLLLHELGFFSPGKRRYVRPGLEQLLRAAPNSPDLSIIYCLARGKREGRPAEARVLLVDRSDGNFSAMERTTGWHGAMVAHLQAQGRVAPGARPLEVAVDAAPIIAGARERGMELQVL